MRISLTVAGDRVTAAAFEASGCGAMIAAASAAVELAEGAGLIDAARISSPRIAAALGGLSPGKLHAADLASDALHRALGGAVRAHGAGRARAPAARSWRCPAASTARWRRCSAPASPAPRSSP